MFVLSMMGCNSEKESTTLLSVIPGAAIPVSAESLEIDTVTAKHLDLSNANVTYLTSEVDERSVGVVLKDIQTFNDSNNLPIYLILDTPGGSVIDGANIISAMQTSKNPVIAIDVGIAASMGFMILEHANQRLATPRAILMAHPAGIGMMMGGDLDKTVSRLSFLKRFVDKMDYYIAQRANIPYNDFKLKSDREFWLDSNDALSQHFLDGVVSVKLPAKSLLSFGSNKLKEAIKME